MFLFIFIGLLLYIRTKNVGSAEAKEEKSCFLQHNQYLEKFMQTEIYLESCDTTVFVYNKTKLLCKIRSNGFSFSKSVSITNEGCFLQEDNGSAYWQLQNNSNFEVFTKTETYRKICTNTDLHDG
uniref:Uncharacterized protein n=1 Tax=Aplanochytrium stocchinoi TaxID=215587 RepID=A0A7S3PFA9_9STRA